MRQRLHVEPIAGEIFRFHCDSQRAGIPPHLVDLEGLECNGICSCETFEFRIYRLVKAQMHLPFEKRTPIGCIHLWDCREYFLQSILKGLSEKMAKEAQQKRLFGTGEPPPEQKRESKNGLFQKWLHWRETPEKTG